MYPQRTPLANLHVTLLDKLGIPVEHLGDSKGPLTDLGDTRKLDTLSGL